MAALSVTFFRKFTNKLIGSEMVTKYAMIAKVYDTGTSLFSILLIALWSAVTFHVAQNNIEWIKNKIRQLLLLWGMFSCGVVVVSVLFNYIIKAWLRLQAIHYEWPLIWLFGAHCSMAAFSAIFVNVLNGMGEVRLQLVLAVISALINIPLSVFLAKNCGMGILGVKIATFISVTITAIAMPFQTIIELRKRIKIRDNKI
jgi:Na+-driven multidrug efflux pump